MTSRRSFLKGLAAAPLAGKAIAENLTGSAMARAGLGMTVGDIGEAPTPATDAVKFGSFTGWFNSHGRERVNQDAEIMGWDPDILAMHLPLATLARIQRQRNREKAKAVWQRRVLSRIARGGFFEDWGP